MASQKGALAQAADQPPEDSYGALSQYGQPPPDAAAVLDQATHRLLDGLQRLPSQAAAAAMLQDPGNFSSALGAGLNARTQMDLLTRQLPMRALSERARTEMEMAAARQAELQNRIDMLNFGYMTAPWGDQGGGANQGTSGNLLQPPSGHGPAGGVGVPAAAGLETNPNHLPITAETQNLVTGLQYRLQRALKYSTTGSSRALEDAYTLSNQIAQAVREDPLAKEALAEKQQRAEAGNQLEKDIRTHITDIGEKAQAEARQQYQAQTPQGMQDDPAVANAWIDAKAKQIMETQLRGYRRTLQAQGINPDQYLPGISEPRGGAAVSPVPSSVDPRAAAELQQEINQEPATRPPVATLAASRPVAPAQPTAPAAPPATDASGLPVLNPQPAGRTMASISEQQNRANNNIAVFQTTLKNLITALELNNTSASSGAFSSEQKGLTAAISSVYNKFVRHVLPGDHPERENKTLSATEQLENMLRLAIPGQIQQAGVEEEALGKEGQDVLRQLAQEPIDQERSVRRNLLVSAIRIFRDRLRAEQERAAALSQGHISGFTTPVEPGLLGQAQKALQDNQEQQP